MKDKRDQADIALVIITALLKMSLCNVCLFVSVFECVRVGVCVCVCVCVGGGVHTHVIDKNLNPVLFLVSLIKINTVALI